jgi:hypothetical protein
MVVSCRDSEDCPQGKLDSEMTRRVNMAYLWMVYESIRGVARLHPIIEGITWKKNE